MSVDDRRSFHTSPEAYDSHVGRYGAALARALIARCRLTSEERVLDVGCGPGALARELAAVVGANRVTAVDPSEPYVLACRQRVPGADVRVAGAEALPFESELFDVVLAQLVVNFMADAPTGVAEMRRVARRGGTVAASVWDYAGEMTLLRSFWDAAIQVDGDRARALDEGLRMRFCSPEELEALWLDTGLREVDVLPLVVSASYEDFDDLWSPVVAGVAPSGAYCASLDADRRAALREEFFVGLGSPSGPFELTARAWSVIGRS